MTDSGPITGTAGGPQPERACPKRMVFGPCGGVRPDETCEVDHGRRCPFVDRPDVVWSGDRPLGQTGWVPRVLTDLHSRPRDLESLRGVARRLRGRCDAVLVGDHPAPRNDFAVSFVAAVLIEEGLRPWVTLACRDRNRVALAAECATLAELGVAGVHCVTGDWEGRMPGADTKVFDLDALRLVDLARGHGLHVSVAEAPASPPQHRRARHLAEKVQAGAQACIVNHAGGPGPVGRFADEVHQLGVTVPLVACISPPADHGLLDRLGALPGLVIDPAGLEDDGLPADPFDAAVRAAEAMLAIDGVVGVNLSGLASGASELASADLMAALGARIGSGPLGDQEQRP